MIFTTTSLKKNYANLLLTDVDILLTKFFKNINTCLTLVNFNQCSFFFFDTNNKKLLAK